MRRNRRSSTSDWVAALRALYSPGPAGLPSVEDGAALSLLPRSLSLTVRAARLHPVAARVMHRGLGRASLGLSYGVPLRTLEIDAFLRKSIADGLQQLVIVGAGLDARAYRISELAPVRVFELDHPSTQAYKRERTSSRASHAKELIHAAIDFEKESLDAVLARHDFRVDAPSIWLWEGVTMYLAPAAVEATLASIGACSAPGSRLAVTYLPRHFDAAWALGLSRAGARIIGESVRAQYEAPEMAALLENHGFRTHRDDTATDWAKRWPPREHTHIRNWERLTRAERV